MDLKCKKCRQRYHIPEDRLGEKRSFFICEKCGERIIIEGRARGWPQHAGIPTHPGARDVLDGIYLSFNLKNIIFSFCTHLCLVFLISIAAAVYYKNSVFFLEHPFMSGAIAVVLFLSMAFAYDLHLYLLSLNTFNRIQNNQNLMFSDASFEISAGARIIFILFTIPPLAAALLASPMAFFSEGYGAVYASFFFPVLAASALIFMFFWGMKGMIISHMAECPVGVKNYFKGLARFLAVENINVPAYSLMISALVIFTAGVSSFLLFAGFLFIAGTIAGTGFPGFLNPSGMLPGELIGLAGRGPERLSDGYYLVVFWSIMLVTLIWSWIVNLYQSLSSVSIMIMRAVPGKSMSRTVIVGTICLAMAGFMLFLLTAWLKP
ncbi:MAG: PHD zinc finger domain-containing protein [Spirochaetes bacterium]|jgi:hypothetical protein|nr:PHD zinc finger domain-containing protein [Spirochaetota bacterium]